MGSRGSFFESGFFSAPAKWQTIDYAEGIKVLSPKDAKASKSLPERSNTPGTSYISYCKDGTFNQLRVFGNNKIPQFDIDYGIHQGKKSLHIHYYKDGVRSKEPIKIKVGDEIYDKYKRLFKGAEIVKGITMLDLREYISCGHEVEFTYREKMYVIQPEVVNGNSYLVIWNCEKDGSCICRYCIPNQDVITQDLIDKVLNKKCFDGKSFYEIESDVAVENIF